MTNLDFYNIILNKESEKVMQPKIFIKGIIVLAIVINCPIVISAYMISVYMLNIYLLILATIISMVSMPLVLKYYLKPQIEKAVATNEIITAGL